VTGQQEVWVVLVEHSPVWAALYRQQERRIRSALGPLAVTVEHTGSTSVPGLIAKPVLDICLGVPDPRDEPRFVAPLQEWGYRLRTREPQWFEHRLLVLRDPAVNLHVFAAGCPELTRMIRFRDRLRAHPEDRHRYATAKSVLAGRPWAAVQDYADAKTEIITVILAAADADEQGY
jgi:GrpB-like predicted nucleotidyltransferase (UPF0157 family)